MVITGLRYSVIHINLQDPVINAKDSVENNVFKACLYNLSFQISLFLSGA
jgi:hypothetical protein